MRARSLLALGLLLAGCSLPVTRPPEEALIARAEQMVRAGDYRGAQEAYQRALADSPKDSSTDRALFGLARLYVEAENPGRDYRRAHENFERLVKEFPESGLAQEARAWRELLSTFLSQGEEAERARREIERVRQEAEQSRLEAERARREAQRIRQDVERLKQMERDLERLKQIERELERQRRR